MNGEKLNWAMTGLNGPLCRQRSYIETSGGQVNSNRITLLNTWSGFLTRLSVIGIWTDGYQLQMERQAEGERDTTEDGDRTDARKHEYTKTVSDTSSGDVYLWGRVYDTQPRCLRVIEVILGTDCQKHFVAKTLFLPMNHRTEGGRRINSCYCEDDFGWIVE